MVVKAVIFFLFGIMLFAACEEKVDIPLSTEETNLLAVEAVITNELKNHVVKLSLPYLQQNGIASPATGASVYIFEDTTLFELTEIPPGSGSYYTPVLRGLFGRTYTLYIQYEGRSYAAQDSPLPVQPMSDLRYSETQDGFALVNSDIPGADPSYIDHMVSWRHTAECATGETCSGRVIFYDLKTADVNEIFKPDQEVFYFPRNSAIVRKKYSVSPAYRVFLRSMLSETRWRGGAFDVDRSNVATNLSTGAVGFFAVCSVLTDTTIVR